MLFMLLPRRAGHSPNTIILAHLEHFNSLKASRTTNPAGEDHELVLLAIDKLRGEQSHSLHLGNHSESLNNGYMSGPRAWNGFEVGAQNCKESP